MLLAALAACMIQAVERVTLMLNFDVRGVEVHLRGVRQDGPPKITSIDYDLINTDEDDHRLELLHQNVRKKYGTISNTVAAATRLQALLGEDMSFAFTRIPRTISSLGLGGSGPPSWSK